MPHSVINSALLSTASRLASPAVVAVALSGGLDSVVLLDALCRLREQGSLPQISALSAAHVHHGLSKNADDWLAFCERFCAARHIPFAYRRLALKPTAQTSLEEIARHARHAALREMAHASSANTIALAHHQDDQAETLLLQLLRGAGPHGLAAMAVYQASTSDANDVRPALWRPLLDVPRTVLLAYAQARQLDCVEDESNADPGFKRNFLRHRILPVLEEGFPGYRKTLGRAAALQAEVTACLEGAYTIVDEEKARFPIALPWFATLPEIAARHVLRTAFRHSGLRSPSFAHLGEMVRQLQHARPDAQIELRHGEQRLGVHRGQIMRYMPTAPYRIVWRGEEEVVLPYGTLRITPDDNDALWRERLNNAREVLIASRQTPSEHLRLAPDRPRRALRNLLREAGIPHWARDTWPRIYIDGELAVVPGIQAEKSVSFIPNSIS